MNRGAFIAILLMVLAGGGLALSALGGDDNTDELAVADAATDTPADTSTTTDEAEADTEPPTLTDAPPNLGSAGTLTDVDQWLQTDATSLEDFDGQVRIVQFWTWSCHNCTATLPALTDIYATYHPQGLEIIGVHTPEFDFEKDIPGVAEKAEELGVVWPIAIDNNKINFRAWQPGRRFWPRTFVIDQNGDIRFDRIGEGKYDELEETVAWLIENGP